MSHEEAAPNRSSDGRRAVFVITTLAVAQPLFDQLGRNPEFLWLHDLRGPRLWVLVLAIVVGLPGFLILVAEAAARLRKGLDQVIFQFSLGLGTALLVLAALRHWMPQWQTTAAFPVASAVAVLVVFVHARRRAARDLVQVLTWIVWLVPSWFLLRPEVLPLVPWRSASPAGSELGTVGTAGRIPIILFIWDELPVSTLMNESGQIDADWFPGFALLAQTSTWYRDTLTAATLTSQAIPAILTGRSPTAAVPDVLSEEAQTVFRLMAGSHQRLAYSAESGFIPSAVPLLGSGGTRATQWGVILDDLRLIYLHLTMPVSIRTSLPRIDSVLGEFGARSQHETTIAQAFEELARADPATSRPMFLYLHSGLPHYPWFHLPSGARYPVTDHTVAPGLTIHEGTTHWSTQPWSVVQAFQSHLLQSMYVDKLMGVFIELLKYRGIWDEALIVVTADHGAAFTPGQPLRIPTESTVAEAASVPLFIKLPGQIAGRVDDRQASTLDLLPTLVDALGLKSGWPMDGRSLLQSTESGPESALRTRRVFHPKAATLTLHRGLVDEIRALAAKRRNLFAEVGDRRDPFRIGPYSQLIGMPISEFSVSPFTEDWSAERIETDALPGLLPARVEFSFSGLESFTVPTAFAIALDERIEATSAVFPGPDPSLSVLLTEAQASRLGDSSLRLFRIRVEEHLQPRLEVVPLINTALARSADGQTIVSGSGERWRLVPGAFHGDVYPIPLPSLTTRVLAWAADEEGRAPALLAVFSGQRLLAAARSGIPEADTIEYFHFVVPEENVFYVSFPPDESARYFALGTDGRASELKPAQGSSVKPAERSSPD